MMPKSQIPFPAHPFLNGRQSQNLPSRYHFLRSIDGFGSFLEKEMAEGEPSGHGARHLCLSNMAAMIINILKETESTTFQEVAERVVQFMGTEEPNGNNGRTLRRRVYDVLNVFVASGFIAKDNKTIMYQQPVAIRPPGITVKDIEERVRSKELGLTDNIKMFIAWRCLIERNRTKERPESAVPVHRTLFIGFRQSAGIYERNFLGKALTIRANSPPEFFSPMNVLDGMGTPKIMQFKIMKEYPELHPMLDVMFPEFS
jgi:hypothetical protein